MKIVKLETRLIVDAGCLGPWNMAADEVMLRIAERSGQATLRFYTWSKPTISLGYFQPMADRQGHASSLTCPIVRRHSGGGAILHDREVTYSLAIPGGTAFERDHATLYASLHGAISEALYQFGVPPVEMLDEARGSSGDSPSFLCFQRYCQGDLTLTGHKIVGSAQRRRRGAILQHGSILLSSSPRAPELPGIRQLCGVTLAPQRLVDAIAGQFAKSADLSLSRYCINSAEESEIRLLAASRFENEKWTGRR